MSQSTPEQDSTPTHSELSPEQLARELSEGIVRARATIDSAFVDIANMRRGTHVAFVGGDSKEARLRLMTAHVQLLNSLSTLTSIVELADPGEFRSDIKPRARGIAERALRLAAENSSPGGE